MLILLIVLGVMLLPVILHVLGLILVGVLAIITSILEELC